MVPNVLAIMCAAVVSSSSAEASSKVAYSIWTTSSLQKVSKHEPVRPMEPVSLSAARGEHEAFQIVVRAGRAGLRGVKLSAGALSGGNNRIAPSAITFYLARYIYLPCLSAHYPDPLPPYQAPFDLKPGETQPIWVDVEVPHNAKAGTYSGKVLIEAEDAEPTSLIVRLRVYDFDIPTTPTITTAFGLWNMTHLASAHGVDSESPEAKALHKKYYDFLLDKGISTFHQVPGGILSEEWAKYVTNPRVTSFTIPFTKDEKLMRQYLEKVRSLGVAHKAYFYFVDEPRTEQHYKELIEGSAYLRSLDPAVNIVSPYHCKPDFTEDKTVYDLLKGSINIWCFVTNFYDERAIAERRSAGDKIWNYVCCGPGHPYANFFVQFDPLEHRMLFWQNYMYEVTGLLYWNTIYWDPQNTSDPWDDIATVKWINPCVYGDGSLLYPGKKVGIDGPVSSVRLEIIRDGIEDHAYLSILALKCGREAVLPFVRELTTSWNEFTRDPVLFHSVRDQIAEKIEQAAKTQ